jgi:hypothetical protein
LPTRFECSFASSPLVSSVVLHLLHSFRVCFSRYETYEAENRDLKLQLQELVNKTEGTLKTILILGSKSLEGKVEV